MNSILAVVGIRIVLSWSLSKEISRHNVDLLESSKQPIAGRNTTIFSHIKNRQEEEEGGGGEDKSSHNRANSKSSASEKEQ